MLDFDTPFRRQARSLKAPNSPGYDPAAWQALSEASELADSDLALTRMATWLAAEAKSLRETLVGNTRIPRLSAQLSTILAVGALNREFFVLSRRHLKAQRTAASETKAIDLIGKLPIRTSDGNKVDLDSLTDATTDAVDSWLYEAATIGGDPPIPSNLLDAALINIWRFSLQRAHYDLWQQALWEDWRLSGDEQSLVFQPAHPELKELAAAWLFRHQSNFSSSAWFALARWQHLSIEQRREMQLPRTVVGVDQQSGQRRRFIVARPSVVTMGTYPHSRIGLEESYLAPLLARPLPVQPELTAELLLNAWYVILDLAEVLATTRPRHSFASLDNVRKWALIVRHGELVDVLVRAMNISRERAAIVVAFLSWVKGTYKGLWGAPLVPVPGTPDQLAMAESVLATSNVVRRMEIWLIKGGLDDSLTREARGRSFEVKLRSELGDALRGNSIVQDGTCIRYAIKKSEEFHEEIDLVVQFGTLLLVGEAKSFLFPADPRERFNFLRNLTSACTQASRKAAALDVRRDVVASVLKITRIAAEHLRVLPIVVLNQEFGVSLQLGSCIVIDARSLCLYLGSGSYLSEGVINRTDGNVASITRHLYRSPSEAVEKFEATMRHPPPLERIRSILSWERFTFPTSSGDPLLIATTAIGDLPDDTRARFEMLQAAT